MTIKSVESRKFKRFLCTGMENILNKLKGFSICLENITKHRLSNYDIKGPAMHSSLSGTIGNLTKNQWKEFIK